MAPFVFCGVPIHKECLMGGRRTGACFALWATYVWSTARSSLDRCVIYGGTAREFGHCGRFYDV